MSGDKRCNMTVDSKFLKVSHITIMYKRVSKQLLNLNHSKATGFDGLIKEIVPILTIFFFLQKSISTGAISYDWETACIESKYLK
jgi:hypothetical protein